MRLSVLLATLPVLAAASAANAASYAFSYVSDPIQLSGRMTGTLQEDGNSFVVDSVSNILLNGEAMGPHPFIGALPSFGGSIPVVTLDGSNMDFTACRDAGCSNGFLFGTMPSIIVAFGAPLFGFFYTGMPGPAALPYDASGWSMRPVSGAIPEPDSWALLIAGFGLTGAALRRRRTLQPA